MKGSAPAPALPVLQLESGKLQPTLIDEIEKAVRPGPQD
jgi:hypothetical protein